MNKPDYTWWIRHAESDSSFLLLMSDQDEFMRRVFDKAEQVGRTDFDSLVAHCMWRAIWEQDRFGSMTSILDDIHALPEPTESRPMVGPLSHDHKAVLDGAGTFPALGVTAFWLPWAVEHDMARVDRLAEWARGCGMTYVRWLGSHDWDGGTQRRRDDYFNLMERTITALAERGLRSQITAFSRRHMIDNPTADIQEWSHLVNAHHLSVILFEIANEFNHTHNGWSRQELRGLGDQFRNNCSAPLALSAPAAETWDDMRDELVALNKNSAADALSIHFPRRDNTHEGPWKWVRQPWHARHQLCSSCPRFVCDNEHQKWSNSNGGRIVEVAASAPLMAFIAGCGMSTHHDEYGVHIDQGEYGQHDHDKQLQRVLGTVMPLLQSCASNVANWQESRVGDGGGDHPFPSLLDEHWSFDGDLTHGVSRAFCANADSKRMVMVLSGVKDYVDLTDVQDESYIAVSLKDGATVYQGHGPIRLMETSGQAFLILR
jgi:hypothetical protein|tara:strand:+ start:513 stop:1976 length:1464 start_codon:yes stop_codon:yes gene_type:complete